jgi:phage/plasmid-like protein (TIGR03299 family)
VLFRNELDGPATVLDDQYVTVRQDTGTGLGVVGARYEVMQNRTVFEFLQDLVDNYDVVWESAGALRGGRKVFVSLRLPHTVTIDAAGINDEIMPFIVAINSHDGSSLYQVVATPWRPVCGNTERFAVRDAHTRWGVRHTRNARDRIEEARRTLGLSVKFFDAFAAEEQALAHTELSIAEFHRVIDDLWEPPTQDAPARAKTNHTNRVDALRNGFTRNTAVLGSTAYAGERAITEYADWGRNIRPPKSLADNHRAFRATLALEGAEDDLKTRAHRRLLTLVRH